MIYLKDPKTGEQSVTLTAFVAGFSVAVFKLMVSGVAVSTYITFSQFSGVDFAAVVAALGSVYVMRRRGDSQGNSDDTTKS